MVQESVYRAIKSAKYLKRSDIHTGFKVFNADISAT
jgi:hypothetical protein